MGSPETKREDDELLLWRVGRRLHVLANGKASFGLVPGAGLRLQFRWRSSAVDRHVCWPAHRHPVKVRGLREGDRLTKPRLIAGAHYAKEEACDDEKSGIIYT